MSVTKKLGSPDLRCCLLGHLLYFSTIPCLLNETEYFMNKNDHNTSIKVQKSAKGNDNSLITKSFSVILTQSREK